jgi:hypothetical protein
MRSQREKELKQMENSEEKGLSAKALKNLKRNEFLRRLECGLEDIPTLEHSIQGAIFDAERIMPERNEKEVNGNKVLKFKFTYIVGDVNTPPWMNELFKLTVDSRMSAKIDEYLSEGTNVLDIQILRTPKGIRYKISPCEVYESIPGYRISLPKGFWGYME